MEDTRKTILEIADRLYDLDAEVYRLLGSGLGRVFNTDREEAIRNLTRTISQGNSASHYLRSELGLIGKCYAVGTSVTSCAADQLEEGSMQAALCWDPAIAGYAMNELAVMVLEGRESEIATGLDLGLEGFESLTVNGKYINGDGWIVITKDNMGEYNF